MIGHCQVMLHHLSAVSQQIALRPKSPQSARLAHILVDKAVHVSHPPQTGDRLSKVLSPSLCYTGGAKRLAAVLRFQHYNQLTLLSAVFN